MCWWPFPGSQDRRSKTIAVSCLTGKKGSNKSRQISFRWKKFRQLAERIFRQLVDLWLSAHVKRREEGMSSLVTTLERAAYFARVQKRRRKKKRMYVWGVGVRVVYSSYERKKQQKTHGKQYVSYLRRTHGIHAIRCRFVFFQHE